VPDFGRVRAKPKQEVEHDSDRVLADDEVRGRRCVTRRPQPARVVPDSSLALDECCALKE